MAVFRFPDEFKEHKDYVLLLKKALQVVKPGTEKRFLYFKDYLFEGKKKLPLVLVDFDLNCKAVILKSVKPTAEGVVKLNPSDELDFVVDLGSVKRLKIRNYFSKMGPGIKAVFVPVGEVDEETTYGVAPQVEGKSVSPPVVPQDPPPSSLPPSEPPPELPPLPTQTSSKPPPEPQSPSSSGGQMDKRIEFEETRFKLRERINALRARDVPESLVQLKNSALAKATTLVTGGNFPDATKLLDQLDVRINAPVPQQQKQPGPAPKLSAYMNATGNYKAAKKTSENGVFALKKAILEACDPELKDLVKARIDQLNSVLAVMDDGIVAKIQEAGNEPDEERQVERNRVLLDLANKQLTAIRNHPFAKVADNNPFGSFTICSPVEAVLTKITTDFAG